MKTNEVRVIGIIYPLNKNNYKRLKETNEPLYVKYIPHANSKKPIKVRGGDFLFFYISHGNKSIVGYSKIINFSFKTPFDIEQKFIERIQMERNEFDKYISNRKLKPLIVFEIDKIVELENPIYVSRPVTMAGRYISVDEIKHLGLKQGIEP